MVDALFGSGLRRPLSGEITRILEVAAERRSARRRRRCAERSSRRHRRVARRAGRRVDRDLHAQKARPRAVAGSRAVRRDGGCRHRHGRGSSRAHPARYLGERSRALAPRPAAAARIRQQILARACVALGRLSHHGGRAHGGAGRCARGRGAHHDCRAGRGAADLRGRALEHHGAGDRDTFGSRQASRGFALQRAAHRTGRGRRRLDAGPRAGDARDAARGAPRRRCHQRVRTGPERPLRRRGRPVRAHPS